MIQILVNDVPLDLPRNFRLRVKGKSPVFITQVPAVITHGFELPFTPRNDKALGFRRFLQSGGGGTEEVACVWRMWSNFSKRAIIFVRRARTGYTCTMAVDASELEKTAALPLHKLNWGGLQPIPEAYSYTLTKYTFDNDFALVVGATQFVIDINAAVIISVLAVAGDTWETLMDRAIEEAREDPGLTAWVFERNGSTLLMRTAALGGTVSPPMSSGNYLSYFAGNTGTVTEVISQHDSTGFATTEMVSHERLMNSGAYWHQDYVFPAVYAPGFITGKNYGTGAQQFAGWLNGTGVNPFDGNIQTPFIKVAKILERIAEKAGYTLSGVFSTDAELASLIIANNTAWNELAKESLSGDTWLIGWRDHLDLSEHLPDRTVSEFLKALKDLFFLVVVPDEIKGTLKAVTFKEIISSADFEDITRRAAIYEQAYVAKAGYTLSYDFAGEPTAKDYLVTVDHSAITGEVRDKQALPGIAVDNAIYSAWAERNYYKATRTNPGNALQWVWYAQRAGTVVSGAGEYQNQSTGGWLLNVFYQPVSQMMPLFFGGADDHDAHVPIYGETFRPYGASDEQRTGGLHFLFFRGMVESDRTQSGSPVEYAFATYESFHTRKESQTQYNYSLRYQGNKGLVNQFLRNFIDFQADTRKVAFDYEMKPDELEGFDFLKKRRFENQVFLVDEFDCEVSDYGVEKARLYCYRC